MLNSKTKPELLATVRDAYRLGRLDCFKSEVRELIRCDLANHRASFDWATMWSVVILTLASLVILAYFLLYKPLEKLIETAKNLR
jgi:hypothetical protein